MHSLSKSPSKNSSTPNPHLGFLDKNPYQVIKKNPFFKPLASCFSTPYEKTAPKERNKNLIF